MKSIKNKSLILEITRIQNSDIIDINLNNLPTTKEYKESIEKKLNNVKNDDYIITTEYGVYSYDIESESIIKTDNFGDTWFLGDGIIKVSIGHNKVSENNIIKVELIPIEEKQKST